MPFTFPAPRAGNTVLKMFTGPQVRERAPLLARVVSKPIPPDPVGVLVVDDNAESLRLLEVVLAPLGARVVTADSGSAAVRLLESEEFAVVLLDVQMPGMDGFETSASIRGREQNRSIPIIFLTGMSTNPEHVFRGYEAGAVDYIVKPFDPVILRSKVAVFVELFEKTREIARQARLLERGAGSRGGRAAPPPVEAPRRASGALEKRLDVRGRVGRLAQACISELGDFALVQLIEPDGVVELAAMAVRGAPDDSLRRLVGTRSNPPAFGSWVFDAPRARLFDSVTPDTWAELGLGNEGDTLVRAAAAGGLIAAPLALGRRAVGVLVVGVGPGSAHYGEEELEITKDVARKAAMAVENCSSVRGGARPLTRAAAEPARPPAGDEHGGGRGDALPTRQRRARGRRRLVRRDRARGRPYPRRGR